MASNNYPLRDLSHLKHLTVQHKIFLFQEILFQVLNQKSIVRKMQKESKIVAEKLLSIMDGYEWDAEHFSEWIIKFAEEMKDILPSVSYNNIYTISTLPLYEVLWERQYVYWLDLDILYRSFCDIEKEVRNKISTTIVVEDCIQLLTHLKIGEVDSILSKNHDQIKNTMISHMMSIVHTYYIKNVSKDSLHNIYTLLVSSIQEEELYSLSKKSKHYVSSFSKFKKLVEEFFSSSSSGLFTTFEYYIDTYQDTFKYGNNLEDFFALLPFLLAFVQENLWNIIYNKIHQDWKDAMIAEYKIKTEKINNKTNPANSEKIYTPVIEEVFEDGLHDAFLPSLTIDDENFIKKIIDSIIESLSHEEQLDSISLENYLARMIKNKKDIRLIDRLDNNDDISLTQDLYDSLMSIFEKFSYQDKSTSYDLLPRDNEIVMNSEDAVENIQNLTLWAQEQSSEPIANINIVPESEGWEINIENCIAMLQSQWFVSYSKQFIGDYNRLNRRDQKLLHERLRLASSHKESYRELRPKKHKLIKFGENKRLRLLAHENHILRIKSKSGKYDPLVTKLYNCSK